MSTLLTRRAPAGQISRVPHLPGLDGMRAVAVVAVMVYHANASWLHGGFLGVEVFFVISGYLITLLLIAEHERNGRVSLTQFWLRRARRLLPALFVMLAALVVYLAVFNTKARGRTRGDILAGLGYVSNWYQIWVGAGYTAREAFAPLRHLWSLAVEEQFYLLWPLVMIAILSRGRAHLPRVAVWLAGVSVLITAVIAILYVPGDIDSVCSVDPKGFWTVGDRCVSVNDTLYLGTITRAGGLMLGAAFAMVWRPMALMRGPVKDKGRQLDLIALVGIVILGVMMWATHLADPALTILTGSRFDPLLFRGGLLITGVASIMVIAAVTHQRAMTGRLLGNPALSWIGTRSYGMYLYHWPIYQIIREEAGVALTTAEFVLAMAITLPITELSYRYVEMPVRQGRLSQWIRERRAAAHESSDSIDSESSESGERASRTRRRQVVAGALVASVVALAGVSIAAAPNTCVGDIECASQEGLEFQTTTPPVTSGATPVTATSIAPETTAVGQTAVPTTLAPTALPSTLGPEVPYFAIGESVMLGARRNLEEAGIRTEAAENRGPDGALKALRSFRAANTITRAVVMQIGTNGPVTREQYEALVDELSDLNLVVVMTVKAPKPWIAGNNEIIRSLPLTHPNVKILDWEARAVEVESGLTSSDGGIHLYTDSSRVFYTNLILEALGLV
jgi:peptidoglycan/LPS O-acetylase OafA/YrhL